MLNYIIVREERTTFDGSYEINLNYFKNFFKINSNDGFIELISSNANVKALSDYISILVVVKVQDLALISSSTECKQIPTHKLISFLALNSFVCF